MLNLKKVMDAYKTAKVARNDFEWAEAERVFTAESVKLTEAIKDAEGRATVRTIDAADVCESLLEIEKKLDISPKAMEGIRVAVDYNAQKFPNAYKHIPYSTQFSAEYKNGSWRLTEITRDKVKSPGRAVTVFHTDASKTAILDRLTYFEI